jgi:hypothetical protein
MADSYAAIGQSRKLASACSMTALTKPSRSPAFTPRFRRTFFTATRTAALAEPSYATIRANLEETATLTTLRDALLPSLLSGELRVRQAEKLVEEAV